MAKAGGEKDYIAIKTGRKTDKTPCFSLCKTEIFIVQISRNFLWEISGSDGGEIL